MTNTLGARIILESKTSIIIVKGIKLANGYELTAREEVILLAGTIVIP